MPGLFDLWWFGLVFQALCWHRYDLCSTTNEFYPTFPYDPLGKEYRDNVVGRNEEQKT